MDPKLFLIAQCKHRIHALARTKKIIESGKVSKFDIDQAIEAQAEFCYLGKHGGSMRGTDILSIVERTIKSQFSAIK